MTLLFYPKAKTMNKKYIFSLAVILLLIISGVFYYSFRKSPDSVKNSKVDYTLAAAELVEEYSEDEVGANAKFLDKVLVTEGVVVDIEQIKNDKTVIFLEGDFMGNVSCSFSNIELNNKQIEKGMTLTVKGKCSGYIMDVVLTKCVIIE